MTRRPRLAPGERRKSDGSVVTYFNLQLSPVSKQRLRALAVRLDADVGDVVRDALFAAHPHLHPDATEEPS